MKRLFVLLLTAFLTLSCSLDWVESTGAPPADWHCSAMSGSGWYAIAGVRDGGEWYATEDYGVSWIPVSLNETGVAGGVDMSADAQYSVVAGSNETGTGRIWYSETYMNSWNESHSTDVVFHGATMSGVGQYAAVVENGGKIWQSSDFSKSFTISMSPVLDWTAITMSRTGQIAVALSETHGIYYSHDYGMTWTASDAPVLHWSSAVAMNDVGDVVVAGHGFVGLIYISRDFGVTWRALAASAYETWQTIACDATGQYIMAAGDGTAMHTSIDYGLTWKVHGPRTYYWQGLALNSVATRAIVFRGDVGAGGIHSKAAIYYAYLPFVEGDDDGESLQDDTGNDDRTQQSIIWFSISGGFFVIFVALVYYYACVDGVISDSESPAGRCMA
jgi:hypothetical protein